MTSQICCSLGFVYVPKEPKTNFDYTTLFVGDLPSWCHHHCVPKPNTFTQIPLYRRHLKAEFHETDLVVTERQDYLQKLKEEVEAEFRFPAKLVSLFKFQYQIDDEDWVDMQVEDKRQAERKYEKALQEGHQAILAKQDNDKVYTVKVGRLKPNQKISIRFSYYSTYEITSESLSYTFPLTSMPPYVRQGDSAEGLPTWHTPSWDQDEDLPYGITLDATFDRSGPFEVNLIGEGVTNFKSTDNQVKIPRQTLDGKTNITFQTKPQEGFTSKAFEWTSQEGQKYLQLCFANYFQESGQAVPLPEGHFNPVEDGDWEMIDQEATPVQRRVVLIGDGSGSMGGQPIKDLKNAMELALKDQPETAKFSLAMFGSSFTFFPEAKNLTSPSNYSAPSPKVAMVNGQVIHNGFACDGCQQQPIVGNRYHCQNMTDYDLCETCYQKKDSLVDPTSTFETITGQKEESLTLDQAPKEEEEQYWLEQTDDNLQKAQEWLNKECNANHGGTEMFKVINEAYHRLLTTRKEGQKYQDMILFMTDGDIWGQQEAQMKTLISKHQDTVSFFSMGIGHSHSTSLVEKLARAGNGHCSHVFFSEDVPEQVQMMMRCLNTAHLRNAKLVWEDCEVEVTSVKPTQLLFENEPHYVMAKVKTMGNNPKVTLRTNCRGTDKDVVTLSLKDLPISKFPLDQSFAMTQLKEWINAPSNQMSKTEKTEKITPLAIQYNVITPYTAAVGIIKNDQAKAGQELKKIKIPIATPQRGRVITEDRCLDCDDDDGDESDSECFLGGVNSFASAPKFQYVKYVKKGKHSRGITTMGATLKNANPINYEKYTLKSSLAGIAQPAQKDEREHSISTSDFGMPYYTDTQVMESLIKSQNRDGSWTSQAVIDSGLRLVLPASCQVDQKMAPTYQVLAFFHRLMGLNPRWKTSYQKAMNFLQKTIAEMGLELDLDQATFMKLSGQMVERTPVNIVVAGVV